MPLKAMVMSLSIGAAVTVAVAWGLAIATAPPSPAQPAPAHWPGSVPATWPADSSPGRVAVASRAESLGQRHFDMEASANANHSLIHRYYRVEYGLPFRSLALNVLRNSDRTQGSTVRTELDSTPIRRGVLVRQPVGPWPHLSCYLPLEVIWLGCAMDSVLFGSLILVLIRVVHSLNRAERVRKGRCIDCCHPLCGGLICSECGAKQPPPA